MPTPPYAKLLVSVNSGATQSGGVQVSNGDTVDLSLESTVGVTSALWELYGYPDGFAVPAGWSTAADGTYFYQSNGVPPPQFSVDANWGKTMPRITINGGKREVVVNGTTQLVSEPSYVDESTALEQVSPHGLHDLGKRETNQFHDDWAVDQRENIRTFETLITAAGAFTPPANPADDGKVPRANAGDFAYIGGSAIGQVLRWAAGGAAWGALDLADGDAITGLLPLASLTTGAADEVLRMASGSVAWGKVANANIDSSAAIDVAKLAPSAGSNYVLVSNGVAVGWTNSPQFSGLDLNVTAGAITVNGGSPVYVLDASGGSGETNGAFFGVPTSWGVSEGAMFVLEAVVPPSAVDGNGAFFWADGSSNFVTHKLIATTTLQIGSTVIPTDPVAGDAGKVLTVTAANTLEYRSIGLPLTWRALNTGNTTSARWLRTHSDAAPVSSDDSSEHVAPYDGTIRLLRVRFSGGALVGTNCTFTLQKNAVDTALAVTVASGNQNGSATGSISVSAGDVLAMKISCDVAEASTSLPYAIVCVEPA